MSSGGRSASDRSGVQLILVIAAVAVLVGAVAAVFVVLSGGEPEPTTAETGGLRALEGLPEGYEGGGEAAPREVGGEPFRLCESCHSDFLDMPAESEDLIFSHPLHLDQDIGCATCHDPPLGHFGNPAPLMMSCLEECHQGETAPNDCRNCHRRLDEIAPGLDEPVVHLNPEAATRESCAKCHDVETWCERCHGLEMPHPERWRNTHGTPALEESEVCDKCHQSRDESYCISCHGVRMPHPSYWYSGHGEAAHEDQETCSQCHLRAPQYCNECHHAGYSPTAQWTPVEHGRVVSEQGATACLVCHEQSFCRECHSGRDFAD